MFRCKNIIVQVCISHGNYQKAVCLTLLLSQPKDKMKQTEILNFTLKLSKGSYLRDSVLYVSEGKKVNTFNHFPAGMFVCIFINRACQSLRQTGFLSMRFTERKTRDRVSTLSRKDKIFLSVTVFNRFISVTLCSSE